MKKNLYIGFLLCMIPFITLGNNFVTLAILAKDKAHTLPLFLACLEKQTWPKELTYLYIRTNNNNDNTAEILRNWICKVGHEYAKIYFDDSNVPEQVERFGQHEWNCERFKVLGHIRQESLNWAYDHNSDYFVVDCDNFIKPETLESLAKTQQHIIAPLLTLPGQYYANFHSEVDANGYLQSSPNYLWIYNREVKGLIMVPVVHCTYFIRNEILPLMCYDDNSYRYEYVIFSDNARKKNIAQYLDNRQVYGYVTFAQSAEELAEMSTLQEIENWCK